MPSFLLPLMTQRPPRGEEPFAPGSPYLNSPAPGSVEWQRWFKNRKGDVPMDAGSVATDFSMVLAFKSLPKWFEATSGKEHPLNQIDRTGKTVKRSAGAPTSD